MRNKYVLIVGCVIVALWAIGMSVMFAIRILDDPFELQINNPGFLGPLGTTTANLAFGAISIVALVILVAWAIVRSHEQIQESERDQRKKGNNLLVALREHLREIAFNQKVTRKRKK